MIRLAKLEMEEQRAALLNGGVPSGKRRHSAYASNQKRRKLSDKNKSVHGHYKTSSYGVDNTLTYQTLVSQGYELKNDAKHSIKSSENSSTFLHVDHDEGEDSASSIEDKRQLTKKKYTNQPPKSSRNPKKPTNNFFKEQNQTLNVP